MDVWMEIGDSSVAFEKNPDVLKVFIFENHVIREIKISMFGTICEAYT